MRTSFLKRIYEKAKDLAGVFGRNYLFCSQKRDFQSIEQIVFY